MSLFDAILSLFNPEVDAEFDTLWKNYFKGLASWCQEARIDLSRNLSYREKKRIYEHKEAIRSRHNTIVLTKEAEAKRQALERIRAHQQEVNYSFEYSVLTDKRRALYYQKFLTSEHRYLTDKEYVVSHLPQLDEYIYHAVEEQYNKLKQEYPDGVYCYKEKNESDQGKHLEGIEYWEDCLLNKDEVKRWQVVHNQYEDLCSKYPDGVETCENHNGFQSLEIPWYKNIEEIVNLGAERLAEIDKSNSVLDDYDNLFDQLNLSDFNKFIRSLSEQCCQNWGCYRYSVKIEKPCFKDESNDYTFWQYFCHSYCDIPDLDYSFYPSAQKYFILTNLLRARKKQFKPFVYDQIIQFILRIKKEYGECLVLFGDSHDPDYQGLNDYHFNYFKEQLEKNKIFYGHKLINPNAHFLYKYVIVVELISTNQHIKEQCKAIITNFTKAIPHICFVSLEKRYDREEIEKLIQIEKQKAEEEKAKAQKEEEERLRKIKEEQIQQELREREIEHLRSCVASWGHPLHSSLKCFSMYYYYPTKCTWDVNEQEKSVRYLIWNFKANPNKPTNIDTITALHKAATRRIVDEMEKCLKTFFGEDVSKLTLLCIPASKKEVHQRRYEDFSAEICKRTGMTNGYPYVTILKDGEPKHTGGNKMPQIKIDKDFIKDKYILLFDDIITFGDNMELFRIGLKGGGAEVIAGFSIGETKHERHPYNPIDKIQ